MLGEKVSRHLSNIRSSKTNSIYNQGVEHGHVQRPFSTQKRASQLDQMKNRIRSLSPFQV